MAKIYRIELDDLDLGQLLDGLEIRAESWQKTADHLRNREMQNDEFFIAEECNNPEEAGKIAAHYRSIIGKINSQMEQQERNG